MSIASVSHGYVFGLTANLKENIFYIEENTILYLAGSNVIIANVEQNTQRFFPISDSGELISALTISPDRHVLAIGQSSPIENSIHIYDLHSFRKRRRIALPKGCSEAISIAFSVDSKYLVVQSGKPDWTLSFYAWEKGKPLASISSTTGDLQAHQVSFNPYDGNEIMVTGKGFVGTYRYLDNVLKHTLIDAPSNQNYIKHVWLTTERAVVASKEGKLLLIEGGQVAYTEIFGNNDSITCLQLTKYGVAVAGSGGKIIIYNCSSENASFKIAQKLVVPDAFINITGMATAPGEDSVLVHIGNTQVFKVSVASGSDLQAATSQHEDIAKVEPFLDSFHTGSITSLDLCIRKPLLATCSTDKSIRIWNYLNGTCELSKTFGEEPQSISLHPSGLYLLAGFSDKLRLLNILMDDLRPVREFSVRACKKCCFANGGHIFAAAHGNVVQIFSTWTFENLENLKGHNGKVKSLYFTPDDGCLVSAGSDGAVYTWNMKLMKRENEHILKSCSYFDAVCSPNGKVMYAVGNDKMIKEISESIVTKEFEGNQVMTQIALSNSGRMLFVGTQSGTIRALRYPFGDQHDFQEHQAHTGPVTKLKISPDDQCLFSAGEDGCLFMYRLTDKEDRAKKGERSSIFADEILITKSDLEEKTVLMAEIQRQLDELKLEHEYQLRLKDMNFNEKLKEVTETYSQEIEALKVSTSILRTEKEKEDVKHQEQIQNLKTKYVSELHELDIKYNGELMAEYEKYQNQQNKTAFLQDKWQKQMKDFEGTTQKSLTDVQINAESRLQARSLDIQRLLEELKDQEKEYQEMTRQNQEDVDSEILAVTSKYEKKLRAEREEGARLKGENGIMRKKFNTLNKDIDDNRVEIQRMKENAKKLENVISTLEKDILQLRKEMADRDEHIQDKERKVYDLKKRNQELEKYKFVLDYRIKELKEQVEPRETHIAEMSGEIQAINNDLKELNKEKQDFEEVIEKYKTTLVYTKQKAVKEHKRVQKIQKYARSFKSDLEDIIQYFQDTEMLKKVTMNFYQKYHKSSTDAAASSSSATTAIDDEDYEMYKEYQSHQQHLKTEIAQLRLEAEKRLVTYRQATVHTLTENQLLIKEINTLREDLPGTKKNSVVLPKIHA